MKTMDTAPLDGTRCLVLSRVWHYCHRKWTYVQDGTLWVDAFYDGEAWQEWCGNSKTRSTARPDRLGAPTFGANRMKELYIACEKSRDEMRLDLEGDSILITVEASGGEQASVFLENPDTVAELPDALDEWLEQIE